jgi:glycosyltransferase involved in cell wall biosynthesis
MAGLSHAGSPDGVAGTEDEEPTTGGSPARLASFDTDNLAAAVTSLLQHYPPAAVIRETRSRSRFLRAGLDDRSKVFVSVGRLSPEKNHARLVRAFAQVHEDDPDTRLVIMGGGKLEGQLRELILSLGLESAAMLTGQVENPYPIMAEGHCFVLSSDYEGQPMVILEARTLGLPIITTAFTSVGDSVPEGAGLVVPQTEDGLAEGMRAFLAGKVPSLPLDPVAYNAEAMRQFEAAIHRRR